MYTVLHLMFIDRRRRILSRSVVAEFQFRKLFLNTENAVKIWEQDNLLI